MTEIAKEYTEDYNAYLKKAAEFTQSHASTKEP